MNAPTLPNWLVPEPEKTYLEMTYENLFETVIPKLVMGRPITQIIREDPRDLNPGAYLRWIHSDPIREERYYEARRIGATMVEDELLNIADAADAPMEDVQRSTLRINTRKWLLGVWNRKRYGESKQIDINNHHTISIRQALDEAHGRVIEGTSTSTTIMQIPEYADTDL